MTGWDFETLLAVGECQRGPRDGRPPHDHVTLDLILGARWSGEPYERGHGWEQLIEPPFRETNYVRVVRSLESLERLGLIRKLPTPPEARTPNQEAATPYGTPVWENRASQAELTSLGRVMLSCAGIDVPARHQVAAAARRETGAPRWASGPRPRTPNG